MSNINDYFSDWQIDATIVSIVSTPDAFGEWGETPTDGATITGVHYNRSAGEQYFNISWDEAVSDVFVTDSGVPVTDDKMRIDGEAYDIISKVNAGSLGETYVYGLAVRR